MKRLFGLKNFIGSKLFLTGLISVIFGLIIGLAIGWAYEHGILLADLASVTPLRQADSQYKFIQPLLTYNIPSAEDQTKIKEIKNDVVDIINQKKSAGEIGDLSLYFQDLDSGKWMGINENDKYNPASLMKVAIMAAYYRKAQGNRPLLAYKLVYSQQIADIAEKLPLESTSSLQVGRIYAVDDLIDKMIIDSDNGAKNLLLANIDDESLNAIYNALGISGPSDTNDNYVISPKEYSLFFRILFNATYLNRTMSERALQLLSETTFNAGLISGLPADVKTSHKFGERVILTDNQISGEELHDCGIIYFDDSPYFLCIMTRGANLPLLEQAIGDISGVVYKDFATLK